MSKDHESVRAFFESVEKTWGTNDGDALADVFVEDGSLINPFGQRADGRAEVAAMYREYFAGMLAGTTTSVELGSVRAVGDQHAFVDAEQTISAPDGATVLVAHLSALLRRADGEWRFVDSRPFTVAAPPV